MTRPTVGKVAIDLQQKQPEAANAIEQMRENLTDYERHVLEKVAEGKRLYPHDFFIVVLTKKERLLENVLRNYFFHRMTCPTPEYDQAVYHYHRQDDNLEFLWVVPAKDVCQWFKVNSASIDKSEFELLKYVLDFLDDTLLTRSRQLNGEIE